MRTENTAKSSGAIAMRVVANCAGQNDRHGPADCWDRRDTEVETTVRGPLSSCDLQEIFFQKISDLNVGNFYNRTVFKLFTKQVLSRERWDQASEVGV
jgi:hypothetical protein